MWCSSTIGKITINLYTYKTDNNINFKSSIKNIQTDAIHLTSISVLIMNNSISKVGRNWFRVSDWTNVTVHNNRFGEYQRMAIDRTANPLQCIFSNNFITLAKDDSLNFSSPFCRVRELSFRHSCTCDIGWLTRLAYDNLKVDSYCTVEDTLRSCYNTSLLNVNKFLSDYCDVTKDTLDCLKSQVSKKIEGDFIEPNDINEKKHNLWLICVIMGVSITLSIVVIVACIAIRRLVYSKTITIPLSEMNPNVGSLKQSKLFSADDREIIRQTLTIMKPKYAPERYDQVYNNTTKLLNGNLTESEKVFTISEILMSLNECVHSGEDFVAFTDILYNHLAPKDDNQNDPVYAEPNHLPGETIAELTIVDDTQTNLDPIYAEPNSVQQPLLTNEYASPVDRSDQMNLYTEPMTNHIGE